jgi:hypothetical protein
MEDKGARPCSEGANTGLDHVPFESSQIHFNIISHLQCCKWKLKSAGTLLKSETKRHKNEGKWM